MKKILFLLFIFVLFFSFNQSAKAILTNQDPNKYQQNNNSITNSTKINTTSKSQTNTTKNTMPGKSKQVISTAQKQKYYNDYVLYLEQTIKNMGCFSYSEISNADISINLYFDSDYKVSSASVNFYTKLKNGRTIDINRNKYERKCEYCQERLKTMQFKPFDKKYADGYKSTSEFFIVLNNSEQQLNNIQFPSFEQSMFDNSNNSILP